MKKKRIMLIILIIILLMAVCIVFIKTNDNNKENKSDITTTKKVVDEKDAIKKYEELTKVNTTSLKEELYEVNIINGKLEATFNGKKVKVNGLNNNIKYVTDLSNFISYDPTFIVITDSKEIYAGEIDHNEELTFDKLKLDVKVLDILLVEEQDYSYGYVRQAFALLETGELKKIEYNAYNHKVSLTRTYENRFIDLFLWGNDGIVIRMDPYKDDLVLTKVQLEDYDENHEMTISINFNEIVYQDKKVNANYVILFDDAYKIYVINKKNEILYAKQDKDITNQNVTILEKYNDKTVSKVTKKDDNNLVIEYTDGSKQDVKYDRIYEANKNYK